MEKSIKKKILEEIQRLDPTEEVVTINEAEKTIIFNSKIKGSHKVKFEDEGYVRALLVTRLVKEMGYSMDDIVLEAGYKVGSDAKQKNPFGDVYVQNKKNNTTFLLIECKEPGEYETKLNNIETQLFNLASLHQSEDKGQVKYLVYYSIDETNIEDKLIMIDYDKFKSYSEWNKSDSKFDLNAIPKNYGVARHAYYARVDTITNGLKPLNKKLDEESFNKEKNRLHDELWGGGSSNYNDVLFVIMRLFTCKIYDELTTSPGEAYAFQINYHDGIQEPMMDTFKRISVLYKDAQTYLLNQENKYGQGNAEDNYVATFIDIEKVGLNKVIEAVRILEGISLTGNDVNEDILGDFFESIISNEFKQDKGQFFTHWMLCLFIIEALDIKGEVIRRIESASNNSRGMNLNEILPYIIDPSCGSGTFLLQLVKNVSNHYIATKDSLKLNHFVNDRVSRWFIPDENNKQKVNNWANEFVYGIEPNTDLATAAKLNMIFHGVNDAHIFTNDGLASFEDYYSSNPNIQANNKLNQFNVEEFREKPNYEMNEKFSFLISNPPFSLIMNYLNTTYRDRFIYADKKNSENLFIERWWQLLEEGGKIGVVLPDSVFDTTENKYIREFIYRYFKIDRIVSVDKTAFQPFTSTKVSILFATKKTKQEVATYEKLWLSNAKEYNCLYNSPISKYIANNDELRGKLNRGLKRKKISIQFNNKLLDSIKYENFKQTLLKELFENQSLPRMEISDDRVQEIFESKNLKPEYKILVSIEKFIAKNEISTFDYIPTEEFIQAYTLDYFTAPIQKNVEQLLEVNYDDILKISKLDYPSWDMSLAKKKKEWHCNMWWVFRKVSEQMNYSYDSFSVENIGYKRTKRGIKYIKNDLMTLDANKKVVIDTQNPSTVLDYIFKGRE
ncbi:TPA: N-6 DNA methylase [Bacillus wiedmannii]|nr:N-6 DNA methylase [Bacillus wiedmannii]